MRALIAAAALGLCAFAAHADPIDGAIGHTLNISDADGRQTSYQIAADKTYQAGGQSGTWNAEDGRLCLRADDGAEFCIPYAEERRAGDSWTITGPTGRVSFTLSLD